MSRKRKSAEPIEDKADRVKTRICKECGEPLPIDAAVNRKYHPGACANRAHLKQLVAQAEEKRIGPLPQRPCRSKKCSAQFVPKHSTHEFCSARCRLDDPTV